MSIEPKSSMTWEAKEFKNVLSEKLPSILEFSERVNTKSITKEDNTIEVRKLLSSLSSSIVNMLKSQGFTEKSWAEFENTSDPQFILAGILYFGIYQKNVENPRTPLLKTRTEGGDDGCFDPYQVLDCILQATGVKIVMDAFIGKCITKAIALELCKVAAKKVVGPIAIAIAIGDFAHCMGWLEF